MTITMMGLDVLSFMRQYRVQLAYAKRSGETAPIDDCAAGPHAKTLRFPEGTRFTMAITSAGTDATVTIQRPTNAAETFVRYLPWQPDRCTYMRIDDAAKIAFTGPLTGCNIYVAGSRTNPVLFHTNSNTNADDAVANNTAKQLMTQNLLAANVCGIPNNTLIGGRLERKSYSGDYYGFVFGLKEGTDWRFYFNGVGAGISKLSRIF